MLKKKKKAPGGLWWGSSKGACYDWSLVNEYRVIGAELEEAVQGQILQGRPWLCKGLAFTQCKMGSC
jgi:hypothetical protein